MKNPLVSFQKLYLILLFIGVTLIAKSQAPSFLWSNAIQGDSTEACKVRTDSRGAVYVAGSYNSNTLQFGSTSITNSGWNDIFLSKYDTSGNLIWVKKYGGAGQDLLSAIATDKNGDILLAGSFENSILFDGITLTSAGDKDAFYVKISKSGNVLWAKKAGGAGKDMANDISTDNMGNTYICGDFNSNDFLFAGRNFQLYDAASTNLFYAKLDMDGDTAWVKTPAVASGTGNSLTKIKPTFAGNILLYGSASDVSSGRLSFGVTSFANPVNEDLTVYGMFTAELNQAGNTLNETALPIDRFQGNAINCRKNIFYSGRAGHTTQFPEGVITKLHAPVSPYSMGSSSILAGPPFTSSNVLEIAEDNYEKIYFTGHYAVNGSFKAYLVSLDTNLNLINDTSINTAAQTGVSTFCESIAIDTMTNVAYVAGTYSSAIPFLLGTSTLAASTGTGYDGYVMKVALPKYDSMIVHAGNDTAICLGQNATLGANPTATGTAAPFTYSWAPAVGLNNTASSNPVAQPTATTVYVVTVTDAHGNIKKDSIKITINPLPSATISTSGAITFCVGSSITLTASAGASYLWSNGGTSRNVLANIPGNYSVKVTDANGCSATSLSTTVVVKPLPVAPVISADGATTFCAGNAVGLSSTANLNYLWSNGSTTQSIVANTSGNYTVKVTDAFGCSATSASITVTANPLPAIPVITANGATNICAGNSVTLSSSASVIYLWSNGSTASTITINTAGNYSVKVTNANGCSATSATKTVTVNPLPAIPLITPNDATTFCTGNNVTLTSSASTSYLWSDGSTGQSLVVNTTGNYFVKITNANGCSATSAPVSITVNPRPAVPTITPNAVTTFCAGNNVTLTAATNASYLWSNGSTAQSIIATTSGNYSVKVTNNNGCSSTSSPVIVTVNALPSVPTITPDGATTFCAGNTVTLTAAASNTYLWSNGSTAQSIVATTSGNYTVKVTNASGCSATSAATTVTVNPLPALPGISATGATSFCAGSTVTLTATVGFQYLWSNGSTLQSIVANTAGNYSVKVTNANGCAATSAPITVTVNPLPATPVITANSATSFCAGNTVTLTTAASNTYLWSNGSTGQSITANATGNYSVKVINANGCSATSATTIVTVHPLPATPVITTSRSTTFCEGDSIVLASSANTNYVWSNGVSAQTVTVLSSGIFTVQHTNSFGCSATSLPVTVTVHSLPSVPVVTQAGNTLLSNASAGNQWYNNDNLISDGHNQELNISLGGTYKTIVTNSFGCTASSANFTAVYLRHFITGPKVFYHQEYPNPASSELNISYTLQLGKKVSISIVDITGRRILMPMKNIQQAAGTYTLSLHNVGSSIGYGMYFVKYEINNVTVTQPVIIR